MGRRPSLILAATRRRALLRMLKLQAEARTRALTPPPEPVKCQAAPADPAPPAQAELESPKATETDAWSDEMRRVLEMKREERREHAKVLRECHARIEELRRKAQEDSQDDFLKMFRL